MPTNSLFDSDTLYAATPLGAKANSPVRCLGKDFKNDAERRAYFREELRKQLPELKKLEGFPIGEDDDIIELSDPPYYTACPNPWLNDFVAEWEQDKKALQAQKKRKADFEVHEPYASDVSEGKNNPIYNAHSYHTKVPHPAIMRYILHYTQPGDIVLDGFAGTGMTGVAAQLCGNPDHELKSKIEQEFTSNGLAKPVWGARKAICGDLSPIASFIAYNYNTPVDTARFEQEARRILAEVEKECGWMYETRHTDGSKGRINYTVWSDVFVCPDCGHEIIFWDAAVDKEKGEIKDEFTCTHCQALQTKRSLSKAMVTIHDRALDQSVRQAKTVPVLINYTINGKRHEKKPDATDLALIKKIEDLEIPYWYPTDRMPEGDESRRNDPVGITHVHHFYIKRALFSLASLYQRVRKLKTIPHLEFSIEQTAIGLSILNRYGPHHFSQVNRNLAGTLYIGSQISEVSPWYILDGKIERLKKALQQIMKRQVVTTLSASNNIIKENSIDYIFIDPPFGANLMYSELNYLWESWLKVKTNNKLEAIENSSQNKSLFDYQQIMVRCFNEYYRVLKPGRWMTVEFSNTSAAVWNSIQTGLQQAGFVIANVAALDKKQGSFKAVTTPTAVKQDLVISCYKPSSEFDQRFRTQSGDVNVWAFVDEHLAHLPVSIIKDQKTTAVIERSPKILYDRMLSFFLMRNLPIPLDAAEFQQKLSGVRWHDLHIRPIG
ncbi:MAG: DNA methylase N-4/N-6 domain-containing protein [Spirochaetes bacterium]|nr:MAG: DNA methylase N-4/N-6 domain-containing protein [Spirochaetota bacterium]